MPTTPYNACTPVIYAIDGHKINDDWRDDQHKKLCFRLTTEIVLETKKKRSFVRIIHNASCAKLFMDTKSQIKASILHDQLLSIVMVWIATDSTIKTAYSSNIQFALSTILL